MNSEDIKTIEGVVEPSPEVKSAIDTLWLTIQEAAKKLHAIRDDNAMLLAERSELEDKLKENDSEMQKTKDNLEFSEQLIAEYESEINDLREISSVGEESEKRADESEKSYFELEQKYEELLSKQWLLELKSNSIPVFNLELSNQLDRISELEEIITDLNTKISDFKESEGNFSFASQDLVRKNKELNQLNDEILNQKGIISEQQSKIFELQKAKKELLAKDKEIEILKGEINKLSESQQEILEEKQRENSAESDELKLMLNNSIREVEEWKTRFNDLEQAFNNENEINSKKLEKLIYNHENEVSSIQNEYDTTIKALNEQTLKHKQVWEVQEKALEEFSVKLGKMKQKIEELNSDNRDLSRKCQLISQDNQQLLSERKDMLAKLENQENNEKEKVQIAEYQKEMEDLKKSRNIIEEKLHFSETHNQDLQSKLNQIHTRIVEYEQKDDETIRFKDELAAKSNIIADLEKKIEQLGNEKILLEQLNTDLKSTDNEASKELASLRAENKQMSEQINQSKQEHYELTQKLEDKEQDLNLARKFEKNYNELVQENGLLRNQMKENKSKIFELAEKNSMLISELNILKSSGTDEGKKIEEFNNKIMGLKSLIDNKDRLIEKLKLSNKSAEVDQVLNENKKKELAQKISSFIEVLDEKLKK